MKLRILCLSILLMLSVVYATGQDNGPFPLPASGQRSGRMDNPSFNNLSGSVRTVNNQAVQNARVEVRSLATGQVVASGYTLPNGTFEFENLPRGIYEVVAALGVQEARERVELFQSENAVHLRLQSDAIAAGGGMGGNATVSVRQFNVPEKARKLFIKAEEAFQKQRLSQAREHLEKALQIFPDYAQALTLRGILNLQDNNVDAARADLEKAIKDDSTYGMSYIVLGTAYNLTRQWDDSVRALERGISLMPTSWQAYFELSKALLGKGQFEAALRQIDKASELAPPNYAAVHLVRAHALLGVKDYNQAVAELERFLGSDPNSPDSARVRDTLNQVRAFMASSGK